MDETGRYRKTSLEADMATAIAALTRRARRAMRSDDVDCPPHGFAHVVALVLTSVAANAGGIDSLLGVRPTSPQAKLVAQLIGDLGSDELLGYRTEPIVVRVDVDAIFDYYGVGLLFDDDVTAVGADIAAGRRSDPALWAELDALEQLYAADRARYFDAFTTGVLERADELGVPVTVRVRRVRGVDDADSDHAEVAERVLYDYARNCTPLPGSEITPDTFPDTLRSGGSAQSVRRAYADAERVAGRSFRDRLR